MDDAYNFSVSEVFQDGRVLVCTCVHIGDQLTLVMDVYSDMTMQNGKRYLNIQHNTGQGQTPTLQDARP